jgi:hypothetical protein
VPLSPAVVKAAAAAGVKPAALITHIGPHDRAVPKPAFELTEKKLDPKSAAGGAKKLAPKTKVKKTAVKGKATAGAKKAASSGKPAGKPRTSMAAKKPSGSSAGQKPSPAVAKSQTNQRPAQ